MSINTRIRWAPAIIFIVCCACSCAEFEQLMKPRVEGLYIAPGFDAASLRDRGLGEIHVQANLDKKGIDHGGIDSMLIAAIRQKRPDLLVSEDGGYHVTSSLIADDVTKRSDNFDDHIYRWTKRRVKMSYLIADASTSEEVWSGIIDVNREEIASYELDKKSKNKDKIVDAVIAAISKTETYPYPTAPLFSDVVKMNFEGFSLNLPRDK